MNLKVMDTSQPKQLDIIILYAIARTRGNKASLQEITKFIEYFYRKYKLEFQRANSQPTYTYFYQRVNKLAALDYIEKQGTRTYRIKRDRYDAINSWVYSTIRLFYPGEFREDGGVDV